MRAATICIGPTRPYFEPLRTSSTALLDHVVHFAGGDLLLEEDIHDFDVGQRKLVRKPKATPCLASAGVGLSATAHSGFDWVNS